MAFVSIARLHAGMRLERDLYYYEEYEEKVITLHAGQKLTADQIELLEAQGISGAHVTEEYIPMEPVPLEVAVSPITREVKLQTIDNVKAAFSMLVEPHADVEKTVAQTARTSENLVKTMGSDKELLVNLADLRIYDDCTYNHSLGVCVIALAVGMEMGLREEELTDLGTCALLHDIGKMKIPVSILNKPGPLTDGEYAQVKQHADLGANFLKENSGLPAKIYSSVRAHHEKYDGTGYPYRLAEENIPLYSRIISLADVYDALTAKRPYRKPAAPQEVVEYIMGGCGTAFDGRVVDAFLRRISPFPVGSCVQLGNGKFAIVTKENPSNPLRPCIRLLDNPGDEIDLVNRADAQTITVREIAVTNVFHTTQPDSAWAAEHIKDRAQQQPGAAAPAQGADREEELERHIGAPLPGGMAEPPEENPEETQALPEETYGVSAENPLGKKVKKHRFSLFHKSQG